MEVDSSALLELKPVKVCCNVLTRWVLYITEDMCAPSVAISTSKISSHQLFGHVSNMERFQQSNLGNVLPIHVSDVLNKWREWEGPLVWRNGYEQWWEPVLVYSIYQEQVLVLPKRFGERLILQTSIWWTSRSLGRVNSTSDGFEEPPVVLILENIIINGEIDDRW